ncbi:RibD family protein [Streptosporangium saharense]|uniref:5-amino-6-(5-phosphoribosylamino)uracil reductase n=1 Tax=Streptosporangium saharense TaxID=1706840 RepID=A0A7W7QNT8_9ACTN|nr:dihydrofolate reductase family protein [Streptosporangium saharense]MBB4916937.1 5-amino-6-(5-phosphoribosylamino)uracil reductase [Streptosporangium saharense]
MTRPFVLASVAMSLDGYIDDATPERLLLSNDEDFDRVDAVRATCDAILVGAGTVRADDPRLLVRADRRRAARVAEGRPESPLRAVIAGRRPLDPAARLFTTGETAKVVYAATPDVSVQRDALAEAAPVVDAGDPLDLDIVLADLAERGVERLMVEGGGTVHTLFLAADLVDELHVVIAPFLVGDPAAPRFVNPSHFPQNARNRMRLLEVRPIGDVILARYQPVRTPGIETGTGI